MARAVSSVVGVALLVALTVVFSVSLLGLVETDRPAPPPTASLSVTADGSTDQIILSHQAGDELDVTEIDLYITVEGQPLRHQPEVPFFAAEGFISGPEGPFNTASPDSFRAGQTATLALAATNDPLFDPGDSVTVRVTTARGTVADKTVTAQ
jgi:FlaG/FlaF family flagellin (archaellin)